MQTLKYKITGMRCAGCASSIEKAVSAVNGVSSCSVNLAANTLVAETKGNIGSVIEAAVRDKGFGIDEYKSDENDQEIDLKPELIKCIIALISAFPVFYLAMSNMMPSVFPCPEVLSFRSHPKIFALVQLIFTIPVLAVGFDFYRAGFKSFVKLTFNMDTLITVGTLSALIYSLISLGYIMSDAPAGAHILYFESASVVVALVKLGRFLESRARKRTQDAVKGLINLVPDSAIVIRDGEEKRIKTAEIKINDIVVVRPGDRIPCDGIVLSGITTVNEAHITGESMPATKAEGDRVIGGSIAEEGSITFSVTAAGKDTVLSKIIEIVREAQGKKAPIAKTADRVAGVFVPTVMIISLVTLTAWLVISHDVGASLTAFVSVLVIACPCSLGLATPVSVMTATGRGAEAGILIKSGETLETAGKTDIVVLDKTGTVTKGEPEVFKITFLSGNRDEVLKVAASCERLSSHPLAFAILKEAEKTNIKTAEVRDFKSVTGKGIIGKLENESVVVGNIGFLRENGIDVPSEAVSDIGTPVYVAKNKRLLGVIWEQDELRDDSIKAVEYLKKIGIEVVMLTGDNQKIAAEISRRLGIDRFKAEVLPAGKAEYINSLKAEGKTVTMVGDGINDAPSLVSANVGIAVAAGADIAIQSADIVISKEGISGVCRAVKLSRACIRNIKQNLFWAFFYNSVGIPLAAFGLLNPMLAGAAMALSSICVVANALRLKKIKLEL